MLSHLRKAHKNGEMCGLQLQQRFSEIQRESVIATIKENGVSIAKINENTQFNNQ